MSLYSDVHKNGLIIQSSQVIFFTEFIFNFSNFNLLLNLHEI